MTSSLRIALVSAFPPGKQSLNEYGLHLAKGLAARNDVSEVVVIADKLAEPLPELDLGPKVRVERVWRFNAVTTLPSLVSAIRAAKVDGVLWNLQMATFGDAEAPAALGLLAPAAIRMLGLPSGVIAHNMVDGVDLEQTALKGQKLRQFAVRLGGRIITRALLAASYLTVTLRGYQDRLVEAHPNAPVHLVPHGTFETGLSQWLPFHQRPRRIVTMGKFGTYKRLDTLLAAFDLLRRDPRNADVELVIGGSDHPNTPGYMQSLEDARKGDKGVVFHGYVAEDDVPDFFGNARLSIFDYTSTTGSSGVLHQAASYGAVPVFPRIGDFVDVCRDEGIGGVHYEAQNAVDMARQMQSLLDNPATAEDIAESNRKAAAGFPFSEVIAFHVDALRAATTRPDALRKPMMVGQTA